MNGTIVFVLAIVAVALVFDFINGFHDSANSIATVVSTRVLSPGLAVIWAAFFNFVAAFGFGTAVAKTIGKGLIHVEFVDPQVILAPSMVGDRLGLVRAILARKSLQGVAAVRNHRVYALNADTIDRPGPRIVEGVEEVARLLHPDLFGGKPRR